MKRYVNFMSNPDERTAIDQFGKGDKCFGVATMMATLPGLPMFGHGQVEGFTEKYGMEYQRPRYDETPDQWLVERHDREIAPLLHSRWLFAESDNFLLYDFWKEDGTVDENVYAYSNARGGQRALVLYHNRYGETRGTVHHSTGFIDKANGELRQRTLQDGLNLPTDHDVIFAFRDVSNGLEYLRRATDLHQKGFSIHLSAYKYHVFLHWRELRASREYPWDRLHDSLHGAGVPNLDEALDQLRLQPLHDALRAALEPAILAKIIDAAEMDATGAIAVRQRETRILEAVKPFIERGNRFHKIAKQLEIERGESRPSRGLRRVPITARCWYRRWRCLVMRRSFRSAGRRRRARCCRAIRLAPAARRYGRRCWPGRCCGGCPSMGYLHSTGCGCVMRWRLPFMPWA